MNVGNYVKALKSFLSRNKETILFASGVAGTVTTGVTGIRAGMRIERKRRVAELEKGELTKKDILKLAAPELIPVVVSAGTTIGCNTGMFVSFNHRLEAAATTIGALSTQIDKIKSAEKEVVGEEKAKEIQKKAVENDSSDNMVESPSGCIWFQEFWTGAEIYTTEANIQRAIGEANLDLTWRDMSLNDFFFLIEHKDCNNIYTEMNEYVGWTNGTVLKPRFGDGHLTNGTPCRMLIFDKKPEMLKIRCLE